MKKKMSALPGSCYISNWLCCKQGRLACLQLQLEISKTARMDGLWKSTEGQYSISFSWAKSVGKNCANRRETDKAIQGMTLAAAAAAAEQINVKVPERSDVVSFDMTKKCTTRGDVVLQHSAVTQWCPHTQWCSHWHVMRSSRPFFSCKIENSFSKTSFKFFPIGSSKRWWVSFENMVSAHLRQTERSTSEATSWKLHSLVSCITTELVMATNFFFAMNKRQIMVFQQYSNLMTQMLLLLQSDLKANFFDRCLTVPSRSLRCYSPARGGRSWSSRCLSSSSTNQATSSPCPRKALLPEDRLLTGERFSYSICLEHGKSSYGEEKKAFTSVTSHFNPPLYCHMGDRIFESNCDIEQKSKSEQVRDIRKCKMFIEITDAQHFHQLLQYFTDTDWNVRSQTSLECSAVKKRTCNYSSAWLWRLELSRAAAKLNKNNRTVEHAVDVVYIHVLAKRNIINVGWPDGTTLRVFLRDTYDNNKNDAYY